ncbi:MAG: hypothetical protein GY940_13325, partial [bacterium]|nr:hypothetical protein [bacterium]
MKRFNRFKTLLVFLALVVVTPGLILISSGEAPEKAKANKKVIKKGATVTKAKGHKRSWTDINKDSLKASKEPRRKRPVMNMKRNRPIVKKDTTPDPVVQRTGKKTADSQPLDPRGGGPLQMADPIIDFAGMSLSANGAGWPPDTVGDVGINHYVQAVNTSIGIYQKSNGNVVSTTTFDSFFGGPGIAGTPCDNDNNGDPVVLYDPYDNRWFILDFAWDPSETDGSWFSIAVSDTSDPTGTWTQFAMRADFVYLADYHNAGIWQDAIYISANMFSFPNGPFQGEKVWALYKAELY